MLLGVGGLINKKDLLGNSAISYAIHYKNIECLKILLLSEAALSKDDIEKSKKDKLTRTIVELCQSIMGVILRMPYDKRRDIFESRLKQII